MGSGLSLIIIDYEDLGDQNYVSSYQKEVCTRFEIFKGVAGRNVHAKKHLIVLFGLRIIK